MPPQPQRLGDGFEIGLGLARAGHPVEQEGGEFFRAHCLREDFRRFPLLGAEIGLRMIGVGARVGTVAIDLHRFEHAVVDQPAQHRLGDTRDARQLAHRCLFAVQRLDRRLALRGHPLGHSAREAVFGHGRRAAQSTARGQRHPRHAGERGAVIIRGPFDQPAQGCRQRRDRQRGAQRAQLLRRNLGTGEPFGLPDDSHHGARPQRALDHLAEFGRHPFGHAIVERAERGVEDEAADAVHVAPHMGGRPRPRQGHATRGCTI